MKILLLNYEFPPIGGGAAKATQCLLKEYSKRKSIEVDVLTSTPGKGLKHEVFADNINIYKVGIRKKNLHYWKKSEVIAWLFKAAKHYRRLIKENDYDVLIIADHGNADYAVNQDGSPNTAHSLNPVPCVLISDRFKTIKEGVLADVAPTILSMMEEKIPVEMTGKSLV